MSTNQNRSSNHDIARQVEQTVDAEEAAVAKILAEEDVDVVATTVRTVTTDATIVGTPRSTAGMTAPSGSRISSKMKRIMLMLNRLVPQMNLHRMHGARPPRTRLWRIFRLLLVTVRNVPRVMMKYMNM